MTGPRQAAHDGTDAPDERVAKRCETCGRFRLYAPDDVHCIVCGYRSLAAECACGRSFDYALAEPPGGGLHCPRCGRDFRTALGSLGLE